MSQLATQPALVPPAKRLRVIPGFGLSMGITLTMLSLIVIIPSAGLVFRSATLGGHLFWSTVTGPLAIAAYKLTFFVSLIAAVVNGVFGLLTAWVLVRYPFPGRRFFDAIIDFPFALPTAVAGIAFSDLYSSHGWIGHLQPGTALRTFVNKLGVHTAPDALDWLNFNYTTTPTGIVIVLIFIGLPFVVRSVQPVLQELDRDQEEAAESLGATRWYTFRRVIFPALLPAWLSGLALAFARALGEYGSVIFISGNIPGKSQIAPQLIVDQLNNYKVSEATAIASVLLISSLLSLLFINSLQWWTRRHER